MLFRSWHVSFQVWMLLALAADALAIAGMALLGRYLGSGDAAGARAVTGRLVRLGVVVGAVLGALLLVCVPWLPSLFSGDPWVRSLIAASLVVAALQQPLASPVFVLDGVLIGAGDGRWLAGAGGPDNPMTAQASGVCETCAYFVALSGSLGRVFGACANEYTPSDGRVVSRDHGCGAHSDTTEVSRAEQLPMPAWDTLGVDKGIF